jgi:hypothetical protein
MAFELLVVAGFFCDNISATFAVLRDVIKYTTVVCKVYTANFVWHYITALTLWHWN